MEEGKAVFVPYSLYSQNIKTRVYRAPRCSALVLNSPFKQVCSALAFQSFVFLITLRASLSRGYSVCIAVFYLLLTSCTHTAISIHRHLLIWLACRSLRATGCHGLCKPIRSVIVNFYTTRT